MGHREGIEAAEGDLALGPKVGGVAEDVEQLFPGLAIEGPAAQPLARQTVNIRLYSTERDRDREHRAGVVALVAREIASPASYVESHLTQNERLAIATLPYANLAAVVDDVILALVHAELDRQPEPVFTRAQFERVRAAVQAGLIDNVFAAVYIGHRGFLPMTDLLVTGGTVADLIGRVFDPAVTVADLDWLRSVWPGHLVVKGIQTVDDAVLVADHGADAVILSTHGGRQLERAPVPFELLPRVRESLDDRVEVLMDGGVMSGADVVAALCQGATAVAVGRAYLYGLMAGGEAGVQRVGDLLAQEITTMMQLLGRTAVADLGPDCLRLRD